MEHGRARKLLAGVEEGIDRRELVLSADEPAGRGGHVKDLVAYEYKLPDLGEGLTEAEIARWLVAEGDHVEEDQPLVEVQTDKTTVEIPSPRAGTVLKILVEEGDVAPVGAVLVVIGEEGEQLLRAVESGDQPSGEAAEPLVAVVPTDPTAAVRATPAVRQLAKELGVELVGLPGSGPGGRIVEADVRVGRRGERRPARARPGHPPRDRRAGDPHAPRGPGGHLRGGVRLHRGRPVAARSAGDPRRRGCAGVGFPSSTRVSRATRSSSSTASTWASPCRPTTAWSSRSSAPASASRSRRSHAEVRRLADSAREGTLSAEELRDSTFTVTSAGKLGGLFVTPLVNHPEVAILGLHRVAERPVVRDGQVVIRPVGNVSVSFDHRVVDGVRAAAFCLEVIERLQSAGRDGA